METVRSVGDASIPIFLLILGIQLARTDARAALRRTAPAVGLKLVVAPAVGLAIALAVGFGDPLVARTFVLEAASPVAVTPLALTIEFADGSSDDPVSAPEYLGTTIFVTTVASVVTVTALLSLLQAGTLV
jgi:hypothetical protein